MAKPDLAYGSDSLAAQITRARERVLTNVAR